MLNEVRRFFTPPIFADEDKTRVASHIYLLSKIGMLAVIVFVVVIPLITKNFSGRTIAVLLALPVLLFELVLVKNGYVQLAAIILVTAAWILGNYTTLDTGGVRAVGFGINLIVVLGAGMLISLQAAVIYGLMSSLLGLGMAIMQTRGFLPPIASDVNAFSGWVTQSVFLMFMAGLLYLTVNYIQQSLLRTRQAEVRLRALIDNTPDFVMEVDRTGKVILANRFPDQVIGNDVRSFVLQGDLPEVNNTMRKSFDDGAKASLEIQTRDLDGRVAWNSVRIGPIMHEGRADSLTVFVSNIAERKQAEAEREQLVSELERRNAELERYTYTLSHELKTPLVTLAAFSQSLEKDLDAGKTERVKSDLARIYKATTRMHYLVKELLELSRIGRLMNPPEKVPFEEIVHEGLSMVEAYINENNVQCRVQPNLPYVHGDRTRLIEVIQNLVDNAIKYMGDQPNPCVEIGMRNDPSGGGRVFFVKDNGIGIDPIYHERVFGLFDKLDPSTEGTGIGLALIRRIIETHGGKIWIESEGIGTGTTFCFTLPILSESAAK